MNFLTDNFTAIIVAVVGMLGSGGLAAWVTARATADKTSAEALVLQLGEARAWVDDWREEVSTLRKRVEAMEIMHNEQLRQRDETILVQAREIARLEIEVARLTARVAELEKQLKASLRREQARGKNG